MPDYGSNIGSGAATGAAVGGPWGAVIGGALGLGKSLFFDKSKENRERKLAAETARWSPWTGMSPNQIQEADPFGSTLQGVSTGLSMTQNMENADTAKAFQEKLGNNLDTQNKLMNARIDQMGQGGQPVVPMSQQVSQFNNGIQSPQFGSQLGNRGYSSWMGMR